jgi:hypothetical protein
MAETRLFLSVALKRLHLLGQVCRQGPEFLRRREAKSGRATLHPPGNALMH